MDKFKIGDFVRITPPPGAPSDWKPRHGWPSRGDRQGQISALGECGDHSRYAYVQIVGFGRWGVDLNDLEMIEPQNVSTPTRRREW
jgi:hypothetical protein